MKASAVVDAALKRIEAAEPTVNAFTDIVAERARKRAAEIDAGRHRGPLMGVPFAVKNLFDIEGLPTRAGSKINVDGPKAARDGALVRQLEAAGAILVGGLNMGEYAYDFTGENAHYGPSRNPHDPTRMTGGSSGGSGAAVAAGEVPLALGSDTNGSIRVPSSLCGLFGLKPTYGRLSRAGSFPFVDAFDHLGPLARSTEDLALSFDAMQGWDPDDPVCTDRDTEPTVPRLHEGIDGLRIAIAGDYFAKGGEPEAFEAVATVAKALGATEDRRAAAGGGGALGGLCHHRDRGRAASSAAPQDAAAGFRSRHARALHGRRAAAGLVVRQGAALPPAVSRQGAEAVRRGRYRAGAGHALHARPSSAR